MVPIRNLNVVVGPVNPEFNKLKTTDSLVEPVRALFKTSNRGVVGAVGHLLQRSPAPFDQMNIRLVAAAAPFLDDGHVVALLNQLPATDINVALEPLDLDRTRFQFGSVLCCINDLSVRAKLVHDLIHSSTDRFLELLPFRALNEGTRARVEVSLFRRIKYGDLSDARFVIERQPVSERIVNMADRRFHHDPKVVRFVAQQRQIAERSTKPLMRLLRLVDAQQNGKQVINRIDRGSLEKQSDALIDNMARAVRNPERRFGLHHFALAQLDETVAAIRDGIAMSPIKGLRNWTQLPNNSDRIIDYNPDTLQLASLTVFGLKVRLPATIRELRSAAQSMHNCLGEYAERVAYGTQVIGLFDAPEGSPQIAAQWRIGENGRFVLEEVSARQNKFADLPVEFKLNLEWSTAALNNELFGPINQKARAFAPAQFLGL